jgi:hypothetical protein
MYGTIEKKFFKKIKRFNNVDDIPIFQMTNKKLWESVYVPRFIELGAISKSLLQHGKSYMGKSRNTKIATWNKINQRFEYIRLKNNKPYKEVINHFEDDDGGDLFVPINII